VLDLGSGHLVDIIIGVERHRIKLVVGGRHAHVGLEHRGCVPDYRGGLRMSMASLVRRSRRRQE
jgi:hypothetical protein